MSTEHQDYRAFLIDCDADDPDQVAFPRGLDVGIVSGVQVFPPSEGVPATGNRLLVFTGTASFDARGDEDRLLRGIVRIRLRHVLPKAVTLVGSATLAALASLHGEDDEDSVLQQTARRRCWGQPWAGCCRPMAFPTTSFT